MNEDNLISTIRNLMTIIRELEPSIHERERLNIDDIMDEANNAILILKKGD